MAAVPQGFWARMANTGIPEESTASWWVGDSFIWPDAVIPERPQEVRLAVPESSYQAVYTEMSDRGLHPVWFDGYVAGGVTFFNVIFQPAAPAPVARHGMTGDEYNAEFKKWVTDAKFRLLHVESYNNGIAGGIRYAALFANTAGPIQTAYHGRSKAQHQALTANKGLVPTHISVVHTNQPWFTAVYEPRNTGGVIALGIIPLSEYQDAFNDQDAIGFRLAYINAYDIDGDPFFSAIWYPNIPAPVAKHGISAATFATVTTQQRKSNRLVRAVTGYKDGSSTRFAVLWNG